MSRQWKLSLMPGATTPEQAHSTPCGPCILCHAESPISSVWAEAVTVVVACTDSLILSPACETATGTMVATTSRLRKPESQARQVRGSTAELLRIRCGIRAIQPGATLTPRPGSLWSSRMPLIACPDASREIWLSWSSTSTSAAAHTVEPAARVRVQQSRHCVRAPGRARQGHCRLSQGARVGAWADNHS